MLQQLTLQELAKLHLVVYGNPKALADGFIISGMGLLVTEIQQSRFREYTGFYSPLYGAFALLDQIGEIYSNGKLPPCPNYHASGIKKALYYFCGMDYDCGEMMALYGLRNALVHDASLVYRGRYNEKQGKWMGPFHQYRWNKQLDVPLKLPETAWDGDLRNINNKATEISVRKICDLAINAVLTAQELLETGDLVIHLKEGQIELYYRYLFHQKS